jgi:hypothetical protein
VDADSPVRTLKAAVPLNGNILTSTPPIEAALYNWTTKTWDAAGVAVDTSNTGTSNMNFPGGKPMPPPVMRGSMAVPMPYPGSAPGGGQPYLATPRGPARDYVSPDAPDGTVRLKVTKTNRDTVSVGAVTLALEGGRNG